jgi:hypothetical protein
MVCTYRYHLILLYSFNHFIHRDPDHYPSGERHPFRKAIQLGLKNINSFINGEDILLIQDLTDFVHEQYRLMQSNMDDLTTPLEQIYPYSDEETDDSDNSSDNKSNTTKEESLRIILVYKGRQKVVILYSRDERELMDLVNQKFKIKPKLITLSSGQELTQQVLKGLSQGVKLTIT